jgi:hypothetical protein
VPPERGDAGFFGQLAQGRRTANDPRLAGMANAG